MQWLVVLLLLVIIGILLFSWSQSTTGRKVVIEEKDGDWWGPWWGPWWRSGGHGADGWPYWRRARGAWPGPWHPPHGRFPGPRPSGHPGPVPIPGTRHLLG
jgi:hypothetical protein